MIKKVNETDMKSFNHNDEFIEDLTFNERKVFTDYASAPKSSGVYILMNSKGEVIYIGKSATLRRRLYEHFMAFKDDVKAEYIKNNCEFFTYSEVHSSIEIDIYESLLIDYYKPICNTDKIFNNRNSKNYNNINKLIMLKKVNDEKSITPEIENFILDFFKSNKDVSVGVHTLKMLLENNGLGNSLNSIGSIAVINRLKTLGINFNNGKFKYIEE